ncbi:MAG: conjugal transfer protein TraN [Sutterella wadsworthensis]
MRRFFALLPLLLPLPNLVLAADPVCTLENRVCAENNNSGKCIRYENTFTCVTLNPAGSRCTVDANPTLTDCTLSAPVCSAESGGICLETTTDFVCKSEPSGEGIRIDDTSVTVSYSKETKGEIPAGCIIGAEVCLDDDARDIEVENWDGHFVSANPACWVTERTILCPSVDGAASCQKLELAGCQKLTDPVCETEEHGVCVRWSSTYRCTRDEVIGDDIITDDVVTTPGDVTEDDRPAERSSRMGRPGRKLHRQFQGLREDRPRGRPPLSRIPHDHDLHIVVDRHLRLPEKPFGFGRLHACGRARMYPHGRRRQLSPNRVDLCLHGVRHFRIRLTRHLPQGHDGHELARERRLSP